MARPLLVDPSFLAGLKKMPLYGIPDGVSKANARLSASRLVWSNNLSTDFGSDARLDSGPFKRSYAKFC